LRRDAILNTPLTYVLRSEIALPLQLLGVYTIGQFLTQWREGHAQNDLMALFDSPQQARHAVAVCANWLGGRFAPVMQAGFCDAPWWRADESTASHLKISPAANNEQPPTSLAA
jgi:hypothetical protein